MTLRIWPIVFLPVISQPVWPSIEAHVTGNSPAFCSRSAPWMKWTMISKHSHWSRGAWGRWALSAESKPDRKNVFKRHWPAELILFSVGCSHGPNVTSSRIRIWLAEMQLSKPLGPRCYSGIVITLDFSLWSNIRKSIVFRYDFILYNFFSHSSLIGTT